MKNYIKQVPEFEILTTRDIFFVLIFTYYALNYNDLFNWLYTGYFDNFDSRLTNPELGKKLFYDITTNDIMLDNKNLSSMIRRQIFGMISEDERKKLRKHAKSIKSKKLRKLRKSQKSRKSKISRRNYKVY